MGVVRVLVLSFLTLFCVSCHNDAEEIVDVNSGYTPVQQKALEVLDGVWVSDEVRMNVGMSGQGISMVVLPSDTIIFLTKFHSPQTFYAYDFLQGKDVKNFIACGTCEFRTGSSLVGIEQDCYFYVSPSGDALSIYGVEKETLVKEYELRVESENRFYAGVNNGVPVYFSRQ